MDHFGIGAAMRAMVQVYINAARRTGRTTSLVESVKDGDRIVFIDAREADRVRRLCLQRGVAVECIVVPPRKPELVLEHDPAEGRTLFDNSWLEQRYVAVIDREVEILDKLQREASRVTLTNRQAKETRDV